MDLVTADYRVIKSDEPSACAGTRLDAGELEQLARLEKSSGEKLFGVFSK